jgi:hypothetical protein
MSELYEADILDWSKRQAALLRRVAASERINDEALDWPNIIEEIESVGRSELRACESFLVQALLHELKVRAWPLSRDVPHWQAEARGFRDDAAAAFAPSMRQRINLAALYRRALDRLPASLDGQPPLPVPDECPASLDELLRTGS